VLTTPALRILKQFRPDLLLAVSVEDRFRAVFEENPDVDAILRPTARAVRSWNPTLCLNLHGGARSAWMTALSGARFRGGFGHFRWRRLYNVPIPRAQEILGVERKVHTAEHLASAIFHLGAPVTEIPRARLFAPPPGNGSPRVVIHPAAAAPEKTWPADGFLQVAAYLRKSGLEPVFIAATPDDLAPFAGYWTMAGAPLAHIKSLLRGAALFIGNDSGPAHMAAAFGVPVLVIFGASDPAIWGPWQTPSEIVTGSAGIRSVGPDQVLAALERLRVPA
jgi:ADP-heptose:LPS heptosyltransferase